MAKLTKLLNLFIENYLSRHRNSITILSHVIGIPLVIFGIFQLCTAKWKLGFLSVFIGYLFQWIGHAYFEKNEVGEWILIKKIVRKFSKK